MHSPTSLTRAGRPAGGGAACAEAGRPILLLTGVHSSDWACLQPLSPVPTSWSLSQTPMRRPKSSPLRASLSTAITKDVVVEATRASRVAHDPLLGPARHGAAHRHRQPPDGVAAAAVRIVTSSATEASGLWIRTAAKLLDSAVVKSSLTSQS
jgi:hypothetical protein